MTDGNQRDNSQHLFPCPQFRVSMKTYFPLMYIKFFSLLFTWKKESERRQETTATHCIDVTGS